MKSSEAFIDFGRAYVLDSLFLPCSQRGLIVLAVLMFLPRASSGGGADCSGCSLFVPHSQRGLIVLAVLMFVPRASRGS